ncbi:ABC-type spermidine/putrescine transport system permease subunit II [Hydrogenispora ethanolica]|jgi:spermidine/putrescine transport system permease protein|uniref:ABC-type spermidine/putrescine transport system permease subunit II n=1 Tax=Hydrogenispora ethanolica TaxID=1082276 RepID=A0A4R1RUG7_HYDET|nr:ABC transporter permease [Hydrogenispora ethanolica]TCL70049.1 ABC-type spermidine/putrescine transport system permease subunit II [Hydrogenispora ethanolica]
MKRKLFRWTSLLYTMLIYLVLYVPIVVLVVYSFNQSKLNVIWTGFTLDWYGSLLRNEDVLSAFKNSLILAVISTVVSAMIGTLAAVGMYRYRFKGKSVLDALLYIPVVIPEIVMGIALLALFAQFQVALGMFTLICAHVAFSIPFVVLVVKARLDGFNRSIEEAAMDLGANPWQTFLRVTLPVIMPGIISGAMLAFTLSLDDVVISFFVAGPQSTTLPLKVFSMVKFGVSPEINALSTIMLVITLSVVVIAESIRYKKEA